MAMAPSAQAKANKQHVVVIGHVPGSPGLCGLFIWNPDGSRHGKAPRGVPNMVVDSDGGLEMARLGFNRVQFLRAIAMDSIGEKPIRWIDSTKAIPGGDDE